jgi:hypothetical protein
MALRIREVRRVRLLLPALVKAGCQLNVRVARQTLIRTIQLTYDGMPAPV